MSNSKYRLNSTKSVKRKNLSKSPSKNFTEGVGIWAGFYRNNPHRFIMDYLGFKLHLFQQILIFAMDKTDTFCFIASRGLIFSPYIW